jgi:hypothetical protein
MWMALGRNTSLPFQMGSVQFGEEGDSSAISSSTTSSSNAMDVAGDRLGKVIVHHPLHAFKVHTARKQIGGNQYPNLSFAKLSNDFFSLVGGWGGGVSCIGRMTRQKKREQERNMV